MENNSLIIVGRLSIVRLYNGHNKDIPAKIDTGADTSSIDASEIRIDEDGKLRYVLFHPNTPYYDGKKHITHNYRVKVVKSSTGHVQIRYTVNIPIYISGKKINATFTLTDRSKNTFPILIGAKMLKNKFAVDVSHHYHEYRKYLNERKNPGAKQSDRLTEVSRLDPFKFYKEVYLNQEDMK